MVASHVHINGFHLVLDGAERLLLSGIKGAILCNLFTVLNHTITVIRATMLHFYPWSECIFWSVFVLFYVMCELTPLHWPF